MERGEGVQVVSLSANQKYELNEAALEKILLQENVRDCPVVVVSVAGAYRGGKSFLLNFFLRYLHAQEAARRNDEWLGAPDESLSGFSWRGGVERNTTGIVMWSQPIHVSLPSGATVAVLLIDTQGTFDSESTVRDCSTIFALSTLLSSVQIYNLSQQIREDDLQYLQLFTSYGKCAANDNDSGHRLFQKLKFLVRDWSSPYEYPYGVDGGKQFLQRKLQIHPQQAAELQEIRQHILSCFDSVDCFLMPHPGLRVVSEKDYNGCIADTTKNFQESLKQLVPLIFESTNLTPKRINGKPVTASDLYYYFKTYMDIFNSDSLPAPRTILQATAEAALLVACESARRHYRARMKSVYGERDLAVTRSALRNTHQDAIQEGLKLLSSSMNTQQDVDLVFTKISQELEEQFSQYEVMNNFKILNAISAAKRTYTDSFGRTEQLCLHPLELKTVHNRAMEDATRVFDSMMISSEDGEDENEDRNDLLKNLEAHFEQYNAINDLNNNAAVSEGRDNYFTFMENVCGVQPCMNARQMELKHEDAKAMAIDTFYSNRNRNSDYSEDIYKSQLIKDIEERFGRYQTINDNNNRSLIERAVLLYDNYMGSICSTALPSLHPEDLQQEHEEAKERAVNEFHAGRVFGDTDNDDDVHKQSLIEELSIHYQRFHSTNDTNNTQGCQRGHSAYDDVMDTVCSRGLPRRPFQEMEAAHRRGVSAAKTAFNRRPGPANCIDSYKERLDRHLSDRYAYYREMNDNNPEAAEPDNVDAMDVTMLVAGTAVVAGATAAIIATGGIAGVAGMTGVLATDGIIATATAAAGVASTSAFTVWINAKRILNKLRRRN